MSAKIPVVIDCDPGLDDTLALLLAFSCEELDIRAVNPVAGNVPYSSTSENTRRLLGFLKRNSRIGRGAEGPLMIDARTAGTIHGTDGLGGYKLPDTDRRPDPLCAWDVLYEEAVKAEGELEVVGLGPMTNLAIALKAHPDLAGLIKGLTLMAGTAHEGNVTPYAEFNVWADPHACEIVLRSGIPIRMCGLDGNESCMMNTEEMYGIFGEESGVRELTDHLAHFIHERNTVSWKLKGSVIHDLVTMACFVRPQIADYEPYVMNCEIYDRERFGQTVVKRPSSREEANVLLLKRADKEQYLSMLRDMIRYYAKTF